MFERAGQVVCDLRTEGLAEAELVVAGEVEDANANVSKFLLDAGEARNMLRIKVLAVSFQGLGKLGVHHGGILSQDSMCRSSSHCSTGTGSAAMNSLSHERQIEPGHSDSHRCFVAPHVRHMQR